MLVSVVRYGFVIVRKGWSQTIVAVFAARGGWAMTQGEDLGMSQVGGQICVACRVTVLSRYNSESLCAPCQRASRDSREPAPTWLWDSVPTRQALARVDLAAVVSIFRPPWGCPRRSLTRRSATA